MVDNKVSTNQQLYNLVNNVNSNCFFMLIHQLSLLVGMDNIVFKNMLCLSFQSSEVCAVEEKDGKYFVYVAFAGLYGQAGALPTHYDELLLDNLASRSYELKEFIDLFNHHLIKILYEIWHYTCYQITYRSDDVRHRKMPVISHLESMLGVIAGSETNQFDYYYSGIISAHDISSGHLVTLLKDYFHIPFSIKENNGLWLRLGVESMVNLGDQSRLGVDFPVGRCVWDNYGSFIIVCGTLSYNEYIRFLPTTNLLIKLKSIVNRLIPMHLEYQIQFNLDGIDMPQLEVKHDSKMQLGWTTWLTTEKRFTHKNVSFSPDLNCLKKRELV